jgi:tetratricopeptide (TPR) repeat protein
VAQRNAADSFETSGLDHAIFGGGLPAEAEESLLQAALSYQFDDIAEAHLRRAEAVAPGHAAVLIGIYRFYFYKGRIAEALGVARICLVKAAREKNFATDWRDVRPGDAVFGDFDDLMARFFMFSLKGYAYLNMRLGDMEEGRAAVLKLLELDPTDKIGAKLLFEILERVGQDDE